MSFQNLGVALSPRVEVVLVRRRSLDASATSAFKAEMQLFVVQPVSVVLNLSLVEFMDSSGLGALVWLTRELEQVGCRLVLCEVCRPVMVLLELVRMDRVFEMHLSEADALASF